MLIYWILKFCEIINNNGFKVIDFYLWKMYLKYGLLVNNLKYFYYKVMNFSKLIYFYSFFLS